MSALANLPHLITLLDDESEVVREALQRELGSIRRELPEQLRLMRRRLTPEEEGHLNRILDPLRQTDLENAWMRWRWMDDPTTQLEVGVAQISAYLHGWSCQPADLGRRLDALADEAFKDQGRMDARELAAWMFAFQHGGARFRGNNKDYYAPGNSDLFQVLETGLGNPISLACLYRLLGQRFGIGIGGCNFPGHFLARVETDGGLFLVDCFNRGRFMPAADVARHHPAATPGVEEIIREAASTEAVLLRILRNLDESCGRARDTRLRQLMRRLAVRLMEE
ncbi:MAG TPA: hypothetical protein DIT13_13700 [Verrucomicrobiales bacterium]|nr:hypothetical protein [Verrucomicrobiales bacterium]HRJ10975.1 transglutaminase-like domain-containing protein [Prosthecobacter sp.]HRK15693.1 transglutaminase-like domain-containing protein [Prosthecobacter sp.]